MITVKFIAAEVLNNKKQFNYSMYWNEYGLKKIIIRILSIDFF